MKSNNLKWNLLIILAIVWGSSFILMKLGLKGVNAIQMGSLRIFFASLSVVIFGFNHWVKIPLYKWKYLALTACFGTFFPVYLFAFALNEIDSSISAILNSLTPLNTLVLGSFFFGLSYQRRQLIGVIIGFIGSFILIFFGSKLHPEQNYLFTILIVIATICYATNVNLIKKYVSDLHPITITVGNFTVLLIPSLIILYFSNYFNIATEPQVKTATIYIAVLGIVGTAMANILFYKLIQISSPIFASSVTYLIPVVATIIGIYFYKESLSFHQFIGAVVVLIGVYFSSRK